MRIQLKAHNSKKFAVLVSPEFRVGELKNDEELYAKVKQNNGATVWEYEDNSFKLGEKSKALKNLTFEEFCQEWRGD